MNGSPIIVTDEDEQVLHLSQAARHFFGYGPKRFKVPLEDGKIVSGSGGQELEVHRYPFEWQGRPAQLLILETPHLAATKGVELRKSGLDSARLEMELSRTRERLRRTEKQLEELQAELRDLRFTDELTRLPNQCALLRELKRRIEAGTGFAAVIVDLDDFRLLNHAFGLQGGDQVLRQVGVRLRAGIEERDFLARRGEDEFVLLLQPSAREFPEARVPRKLVAARLVRLLELLAPAFEAGGQQVHLEPSLGISLYPDDAANAQEVLQHAEVALYQAKRIAGQHFCFYAHSKDGHPPIRQKDIVPALKAGEFFLEYQPMVRFLQKKRAQKLTRQKVKATMVGVQVSFCWHHRLEGRIDQGFLLSMARGGGQLPIIGDWLLARACEQLQAWRDVVEFRPLLGLDLFATQLLEPGLADRVAVQLQRLELDPGFLILGCPELSSHLPTDARDNLAALTALGATVAALDFGEPNLNLESNALSGVRLAGGLVSDCNDDQEAAERLARALQLAGSLKLRCIAPEVSTVEQARFLAFHGCELAYGPLFGNPMDSSEILPFARQRKIWKW